MDTRSGPDTGEDHDLSEHHYDPFDSVGPANAVSTPPHAGLRGNALQQWVQTRAVQARAACNGPSTQLNLKLRLLVAANCLKLGGEVGGRPPLSCGAASISGTQLNSQQPEDAGKVRMPSTDRTAKRSSPNLQPRPTEAACRAGIRRRCLRLRPSQDVRPSIGCLEHCSAG